MQYHPKGNIRPLADVPAKARTAAAGRARRRLWQARWRERHPVLAAWHTHLWNAKQRGIPVHWDLFEFGLFCAWTGYHILRRDGWEIDRNNHRQGYSLDNCQLLGMLANRIKGGLERWQ